MDTRVYFLHIAHILGRFVAYIMTIHSSEISYSPKSFSLCNPGTCFTCTHLWVGNGMGKPVDITAAKSTQSVQYFTLPRLFHVESMEGGMDCRNSRWIPWNQGMDSMEWGMDSMEWGMDSMEWWMDSMVFPHGFHTCSILFPHGFHTFSTWIPWVFQIDSMEFPDGFHME